MCVLKKSSGETNDFYNVQNVQKRKKSIKNSSTYSVPKLKSSKKNGKTYSQRKRDSFDYRTAYFKNNPGIYGNIWFCSQCGKILIGRKNVVIDHIIPLNSIAGVNKTINTVAICQKCNSSKSDTIDYRVAKGYLAKIFEVITSYFPDCIALIVSLIIFSVIRSFSLVHILVKMIFTNNRLLYYFVILVICLFFVFKFL